MKVRRYACGHLHDLTFLCHSPTLPDTALLLHPKGCRYCVWLATLAFFLLYHELFSDGELYSNCELFMDGILPDACKLMMTSLKCH